MTLRTLLVHGWVTTMLLGPSGCTIKTSVVNVGQKTSLETQLMGELEPLSEEEALAASVRAANGPLGPGSLDAIQAEAVAARRRQLFNRDDVDELKARGCVGEALAAVLQTRDCALDNDAPIAALRSRLIEEENQDRKVIIDWLVAIDPSLTRDDRPQVARIYRAALLERARPGDWIQNEDGTWAQKEAR